ncbi:MAG: alpha/beta hydrolase-fold protein [Deltaproteobacteria bacterium]|nr:alpha/beta hydrolase-fold protein [Deltaproteobacteria bacterium]
MNHRSIVMAALAVGAVLSSSNSKADPEKHPSGAAAATKPPFINWWNPPPAPQPFLVHRGYMSRAMHTKVGYNIYLPPGYAASRKRYPVVYWFHGFTCNESNDQFPAAIIDRSIRNGTIPPLIFVYASGGSHSFYSDSPDGKYLSETTIVQELIPFIDRTYRTIPDRAHRGVQGMSMGGLGAFKLAFGHPELFSSVTAFAGGFIDVKRMSGKHPEVFHTMFNDEPARFMANHPFVLAKKNADAIAGKLAIRMIVGTNDHLISENRAMHALLDQLKIPHQYEEVEGVAHELGKLATHMGSAALELAVSQGEPLPGPATVPDAGDAIDGPWNHPKQNKVRNVEHHSFYSPSMRRQVGFNIYLPDAYRAEPLKRFPVVYYLHGRTDDENTHLQNINVLDRAIADGKVLPFIYVYTYGGRTSFFSDSVDGTIRGETVIIKELIPHVDGAYRTIANRVGRALQGFSMGGFGAMKLAVKHPDMFSSVVAYSGGYLTPDEVQQRHPETWARLFASSTRQFEACSPLALVPRAVRRRIKWPAIRMVVGGDDFALPWNRRMHAVLQATSVAHEYEEVPGIAHDPQGIYGKLGAEGFAFTASHFDR